MGEKGPRTQREAGHLNRLQNVSNFDTGEKEKEGVNKVLVYSYFLFFCTSGCDYLKFVCICAVSMHVFIFFLPNFAQKVFVFHLRIYIVVSVYILFQHFYSTLILKCIHISKCIISFLLFTVL